MARGYPDYNNPLNNVGAVSFDIAELAARLGSISKINRLGNVIFQDDFSEGMSGWLVIQGVDAYAKCVTSPVYEGVAAVKLGVSLSNGWGCNITKQVPLHDLGRYGIEKVIAFEPTGGNGVILACTLNPFTPSKNLVAILVINPITSDISIYTDIGGGIYGYLSLFTGLPRFNPLGAIVTYHHVKLVIDIQESTYVRLIFDQYSIDLTSHPLASYVYAGYTGILIRDTILSGSSVSYCMIDNNILTMNEP